MNDYLCPICGSDAHGWHDNCPAAVIRPNMHLASLVRDGENRERVRIEERVAALESAIRSHRDAYEAAEGCAVHLEPRSVDRELWRALDGEA